jgi:hypothetical protein
MINFTYHNRYVCISRPMHYTNKTSTTLAIVAIVTAVALVTAGSITASALAKKHASTITLTSASTKKATGSSSQLISCIRSLHGQITLAAVDDCYNTTSGKQFGSSPSGTGSSSSSSASALMTEKTPKKSSN